MNEAAVFGQSVRLGLLRSEAVKAPLAPLCYSRLEAESLVVLSGFQFQPVSKHRKKRDRSTAPEQSGRQKCGSNGRCNVLSAPWSLKIPVSPVPNPVRPQYHIIKGHLVVVVCIGNRSAPPPQIPSPSGRGVQKGRGTERLRCIECNILIRIANANQVASWLLFLIVHIAIWIATAPCVSSTAPFQGRRIVNRTL